MKKIRAGMAIMKKIQKYNQNLFKSIKTACNNSVASKIEVVDDWQLKVVVPGTEPMR